MASDEYRRVGKWLRRCRRNEEPNVSQEAVANVAGVSRSTYRNWEEGRSAPDVIHLERIKQHYGWVSRPNC